MAIFDDESDDDESDGSNEMFFAREFIKKSRQGSRGIG